MADCDDECDVDLIPEDHYVCTKYRSILHRLFLEQNDAYHEIRETTGEGLFPMVKTLMSSMGITEEEMDHDASLAGSFIWHSALRRVRHVPRLVRGEALYESPPSEQLQRAIQTTKRRYLETNWMLSQQDACSILTCLRPTIFSMEDLPYCEVHCGLALLYAVRHAGTEGMLLFGRVALKQR